MAEPLFSCVPATLHGGRPPGMRASVYRLPNRDIVLEYEDGSQEVLSAAQWCLCGPSVEANLPWWQAAVEGLAVLAARPKEEVARELRDLVYRLQVDAGLAQNNRPFHLRCRPLESLVETAEIMFRMMEYFRETKNGR